MRNFVKEIVVLGVGSLLMVSPLGFGQSVAFSDSSSSGSGSGTSVSRAAKPVSSTGGAARLGAAAKLSLLGEGFEVAARVTPHTNVRAGFNMFSYSGETFDSDSISYNGQISFKTVKAYYDIFPWRGSFRVSPGMLVFLGDPVTAKASVAPGNYFTLSGQSYISSTSDPVNGLGKLDFNRAAPEITVGWGNLVSRNEKKRFSAPFEVGMAFPGAPKSALNLSGSVCDSSPLTGSAVNCRSIASDSKVQGNVVEEQASLNHKMSSYQIAPILSVGFGVKFKQGGEAFPHCFWGSAGHLGEISGRDQWY